MLHHLLKIDFASFPIYQIMLIAAFVAGWIMYGKMFRKGNFSRFVKRRIRRCFFWGAVFALVASNVVNWLFYPQLMQEPLQLRITQGVYSSFFGLLVFYGVSALLLRMGKMKVRLCLNYVTPAVLLALFIARLGCTLNGCCYGKLLGADVRFPTTELEAVFALVLCIVLTKKATQKRFWIFGFSYTLLRFVLEFFRGDDRGSLLGITALTPVQLFAIPLWILCTVMLFKEPFCRYFLLEHKLLARREKRLQRLESKGKKPYEPLPYDYTPAKRRGNPLHPIGVVLLCLVVFFGGLVYLNPFGFRWTQNLQYSLDAAFAGSGHEQQAGVLTGLAVQDASEMGTAKSKNSALKIVTAYDQWTGADLICTYETVLPSGNRLYGFTQQVEGVQVFGTGRVLVTDSNYNALYVAGDETGLAFTNEVLTDYSAMTLAQAFGEELVVLERQDCWYDTGEGLVAAEQLILSSDGATASMGAVVDRSSGGILALTGTKLRVCASAESSRIYNAVKTVSALLAEEDLTGLEKIKNPDHEISFLEQDRYTVMQALIRAYEKSGLTAGQFRTAMLSAQQIAERTPNMNQVLFSQILSREVAATVRSSGATEKDAQRSAKKVTSAFRASGIRQAGDEAVTALTAAKRKTSFRHSLDCSTDSDLFTLTASAEMATELTLTADSPVKLEIYEAGGRAVTALYVEGEESLTLYPEDGTAFTVRVSSPKGLTTVAAASADYKLSVKAVELEETVPAGVTHSVRVIKDSFNSSNVMTFYAFCVSDLTSEENLGDMLTAGIMAPMLDSCSGCIGLEENVDTAKTLIAMTSIPGGEDREELKYLKGARMELSYFAHVENEEGIAVKAKMKLTVEDFPLYDGYIFYQLAPANRSSDGLEEQTAQLVDQVGSFLGTDYYITAFNTSALYTAFGDTEDGIRGDTELTSLYELQQTVTVEYDGMTFRLKQFDEQQALRMGHSREKVDSFYNYTLRQNILTLKEQRASYMATQACYSALSTCTDVASTAYEVVTDPFGFVVEEAAGQNETTKSFYMLYEVVTDPAGVVTDAVVDSFVQTSRVLAERAQAQVDSINGLITKYENMKR